MQEQILVVDDKPAVRGIIVARLAHLGYTAIMASAQRKPLNLSAMIRPMTWSFATS